MPLLSDITLGQYFAADSFVHRLDPRTKLITTFALMIVLMAIHQWVGFVIIGVFLSTILVISQIPIGIILRNLRPFLWLFILTIGIHGLLSQNNDTWTIPYIHLSFSTTGLLQGLIYSLRLASFIFIAALLTLTTSPVEITDALETMLAPLQRFRVPIHEIVMMMTLAMRFIPTLMDEADKLRKAQLSRGVSFNGSIKQRVQHIIPLVIPLFVSVFRRADELALAMDSRCYTGGHGRTRYRALRMKAVDYIVMVGVIFISAPLGVFL
ncbi:energy-coupling factor transporter transmembrane protein EcfT [candidate division KSB1 bacterium]|nr:energy-coupling factor transporter transmembrane protein EcfT [candidate division KSB1 bacterium]